MRGKKPLKRDMSNAVSMPAELRGWLLPTQSRALRVYSYRMPNHRIHNHCSRSAIQCIMDRAAKPLPAHQLQSLLYALSFIGRVDVPVPAQPQPGWRGRVFYLFPRLHSVYEIPSLCFALAICFFLSLSPLCYSAFLVHLSSIFINQPLASLQLVCQASLIIVSFSYLI